MGVSDPLRRDEPSSSRPADVPSSPADREGKGVAENGYEMSSDIDSDEVRMMGERTTLS